jgi:RND family efflux transporter MFP subunit
LSILTQRLQCRQSHGWCETAILQNDTNPCMSCGMTIGGKPWRVEMTKNKRHIAFVLFIGGFCSLAQAADSIPVTVERLGDLLVDRELRAPAIVISANRAAVTSQVSALISEVLKDVGDQVKRDDLLIRLDDANARHALAQARALLSAIDAQIVEGKSRVAKAEELLEKNFISDEELIARQSNLGVLEANRLGQQVAIEIAELELERTRIKSPFNAAVIERQAQVGSYAQPGTPLITLVQTDRIEIDVELDPRYSDGIPQVSKLRFVSQGKEWPVDLLRLSDVIDESSRIVHARFRFEGDSAAIGASGQLVWNESTGLVPVALIVQRGSQFGVFVAENGKARFVAIPNAQEGRPAPIALPLETLVVSRGHVRLQDGDALQVSQR